MLCHPHDWRVTPLVALVVLLLLMSPPLLPMGYAESPAACQAQLFSGTPFVAGCTNLLGTLRTTWLAQCTLPYMDVTLLKSITCNNNTEYGTDRGPAFMLASSCDDQPGGTRPQNAQHIPSSLAVHQTNGPRLPAAAAAATILPTRCKQSCRTHN